MSLGNGKGGKAGGSGPPRWSKGSSKGPVGKGGGKGQAKGPNAWESAKLAWDGFRGRDTGDAGRTQNTSLWACRGPGGCSYQHNPASEAGCVSCGLPWSFAARPIFWKQLALKQKGGESPGGAKPTVKGNVGQRLDQANRDGLQEDGWLRVGKDGKPKGAGAGAYPPAADTLSTKPLSEANGKPKESQPASPHSAEGLAAQQKLLGQEH